MFGCCKSFSGKYIFSGNANFRKMKIFPCVWLRFKKLSRKYFLVFGKEEGKHKSENTSHNPEKKKNHQRRKCFQSDDCAIDGAIARRDRDRRRDRDLTFFARSRSTARSQSSRDRDRRSDLAKIAISPSRSRTGAGAGDLGLDLLLLRARARSLSLSLSLSFSGNALKEK